MEENEILNPNTIIDLETLKNSLTHISKKIILVNSEKYTEDAFDYLLDLIDESESIAFIVNERKIYTQGEYFGGDLWEDSLNYFSKHVIIDDNNEILNRIYAQSAKDSLQWKGEGGIQLYNDYDIKREANTIHIKYNLEAAVDEESVVRVGDKILALTVGENNKLAIAEFEPINITWPTIQMLEYDKGDTEISIPLTIQNKQRLTSLVISASSGVIPSFNWETDTITANIKNNTNVTFYIDYKDGKTLMTESFKQEWGYAYCYGITQITEENFDRFKKGLENKFNNKEITINQTNNTYGWFAYPKNISIEFSDKATGLSGGWEKAGTFMKYNSNIEYQVYKTEQSGLGSVTWKITKK